jgi:hypothetical protein
MAMDEEEGIIWAALTAALGLGVATLARKAMAKSWTKRRGFVPGKPGDGQTTWKDAALFAVATGAVVGLSRLVADRLVVEAKKAAATRRA